MFFLLLLASVPIRGIFIAPHFEGERTDAQLASMIDEVEALGASHVIYVVQWGQKDIYSTQIGPYQWGTDDDEIERLAQATHDRGMKVVLFPILHLAEIAPGRWRGRLDPTEREVWWSNYHRFILHYAELAARVDADLYSLGSELGTMEGDVERWHQLAAHVRARYQGPLTYSANWDHVQQVAFWDALDLVGINAYFPLTDSDDASQAQLTTMWGVLQRLIGGWRWALGKPLLFTEVGYPSVDGGARRPYHYDAQGPIDLEEQRRAVAAFTTVWGPSPGFAGTFWWIWTGAGGSTDPGYSVRNKPAQAILKRWFLDD